MKAPSGPSSRTSGWTPDSTLWQLIQVAQASVSEGARQFKSCASRCASVRLPTPAGPAKIMACGRRFRSIARISVSTALGFPRKERKLEGRCMGSFLTILSLGSVKRFHFAAGPQARWRGASDEQYPVRYVRSEQQSQRPAGRSHGGARWRRARIGFVAAPRRCARHRLRRGASHMPARRSRQSAQVISSQTLTKDGCYPFLKMGCYSREYFVGGPTSLYDPNPLGPASRKTEIRFTHGFVK